MSAPHPTEDYTAAPIPASTLPGYDATIKPSEGEKVSGLDFAVLPANDLAEEGVPSEEDLATLRKVPAPLPLTALCLCFIEFAERASYYGSKGPFNNCDIMRPLPKGGNGAGAVAKGAAGKEQKAGALGRGSVTATALVQTFVFASYVMPIYGGIVSDTQWGRFKTICVGTAVGAFAHVLLVIPAIPSVIAHPNGALGAFIISMLILAFAAGFIKPSLGPLMCDQSPVGVPTLKTLETGERVIVDPGATVQRYLLIFYWCINIGAFFALATSYSSRFVGFWLAFLAPGIIYMFMPIVLIFIGPRIYKAPPQGSVLLETIKVFRILLSNGGWKKINKGEEFWNQAKPSYIEQRDGTIDLDVIFWDDKFVDEIKQTLQACGVFALIPIFSLGDGGIGNSTNSMSGAMILNGVPNDLIDNFNALSIIVAMPIITYGLYPLCAKLGFPLKPMTRMMIGFLTASVACIIAAIIQWRVYETSPCGWSGASTCDEPSSVSLWAQIPIIAIPAVGELFVNPTSYELAYTRSPARMKGLVYSLALFNSAIAAAISLGASDAIQDPYLIWPWVALACASFVAAFLFPTYFRHLNEPLANFADKDRMEGLEQPRAKQQAGNGEKEAIA